MMNRLFSFSRMAAKNAAVASSSVSQQRSFSSMPALAQIKNVTVFGAGLMGAGIAHVSAQSGHKVTVVDTSEKALENGKDIIVKSLKRVVKKKYADEPEKGEKAIADVMNNLSWTTSLELGAKDADLIVEAIIENMDIKQELWGKLDKLAPSHSIFASNTSSLIIKDIGSATERQDRFAGLHFFNPGKYLNELNSRCPTVSVLQS